MLRMGCGAGANSIMLADCGFDVLAIDGSQTAISRLENRIAGTDKEQYIQCRVLDFNQLHVVQDRFGFIVDNLSVYANAIDEISECLSTIRTLMGRDCKFYSRVWGKEHLVSQTQESTFTAIPKKGLAKTLERPPYLIET